MAPIETYQDEIDQVKFRLENFPPTNIFNVDETGLLYALLPNSTYYLHQEEEKSEMQGSNQINSKERISAVLCCNATGSIKVPISLIGKSKNPFCIDEAHTWSCLYWSQKSA